MPNVNIAGARTTEYGYNTSTSTRGVGEGIMKSSTENGQNTRGSLDEVLMALADPRRRAVVRVLRNADEASLGIEELVGRVLDRVQQSATAREQTTRTQEESRKRLRTSLYHTHLPKLEACGLIEFDANGNHVRGDGYVEWKSLVTVVESYDDD